MSSAGKINFVINIVITEMVNAIVRFVSNLIAKGCWMFEKTRILRKWDFRINDFISSEHGSFYKKFKERRLFLHEPRSREGYLRLNLLLIWQLGSELHPWLDPGHWIFHRILDIYFTVCSLRYLCIICLHRVDWPWLKNTF